MQTLRPRLLVALAVLLAACTNGGEPAPAGTFEPLQGGPAGIEDVVQHLAEAPAYPVAVEGDAVLVELRSPGLERRHHLFLADAAATELGEELVRGSVLRLGGEQSLSASVPLEVARLDGDEVTEVADCAAPCEVNGPALVAPEIWFSSIRVTPGWLLVEPAPTE